MTRPHGRASISAARPRALGICDRCGAMLNHDELRWTFQWVGTKLQNTRMLVCEECYDIPQEQLRTIILPADPVPIANARPENYVNADNPMSAVGADANFFRPTLGSRIGSLTGGGGINSAFDGNINKPFSMSACNSISDSSYGGYVGIDWGGYTATLNLPSSMQSPTIEHSLLNFKAYAPRDRGFLGSVATSYLVQGSPTNLSAFASWTTISSGTVAGTNGESIDVDCTGNTYRYHRLAILGNGATFISIAQVEFNVAQIGEVTVST